MSLNERNCIKKYYEVHVAADVSSSGDGRISHLTRTWVKNAEKLMGAFDE